MKTLVFVGPPGSGKTTTAGHTFRSGLLEGRKIYIINDEGDGTESTVDAGILKGIEGLDLSALTSGCIGCRDEKEFREAIRQIQAAGNIDWLVIEPVGYAAGHEVPDILHSLGIHPTVVCLVDVENFEDNLVDGFMSTQVHAAQVVALTKYGSATSLEDSVLESVMAFIGRYNSKAPAFLLAKGAELPEWVLNHRHCCHESHGHDHHHHDHHHDHDEDHGTFSITFKLRPEATYQQIQQIVTAIPAIFRGKGVAEGRQWHLVQKTWEPEGERLTDDRTPFATFYSREPISADDFLSIAISTKEAYENKDTKQILRSRTVSPEDLERAIRKRLSKFPTEAFINRFGDLVTHPEILSVVMQLAQRESVPQSVFAEMVRMSICYWLSAVHLLQSRDWENRAVAEWQRRLGIALGWFGWYNPNEVGDEQMTQVVIVRPAHLMCQGLATLDRFHSDFEKAKVQCEEIRDVIKFGLKYEGMDKNQALLVMCHCLALVERENRRNLTSKWEKAIAEVEDFDASK